MHSTGELFMCLGDFNRHIGGHIDGGYGIDQRNLEGTILLVFLEDELWVSNTWFKREEKRKMTFRMGENET